MTLTTPSMLGFEARELEYFPQDHLKDFVNMVRDYRAKFLTEYQIKDIGRVLGSLDVLAMNNPRKYTQAEAYTLELQYLRSPNLVHAPIKLVATNSYKDIHSSSVGIYIRKKLKKMNSPKKIHKYFFAGLDETTKEYVNNQPTIVTIFSLFKDINSRKDFIYAVKEVFNDSWSSSSLNRDDVKTLLTIYGSEKTAIEKLFHSTYWLS